MKFETWLTDTQETAVNQFGFTPEQADSLDLIDMGLLYDAGLTPFQALVEFRASKYREL